MRRPLLAFAAAILYVASLAAPAAVGASHLTPSQAQALAQTSAERRANHARYVARVAAEAKMNTRSARAIMTVAAAVSAACDHSCVRLNG